MMVYIEHYDGFKNWVSRDFNARDMMQHVKQFEHVPRERFEFYNGYPAEYFVNYNQYSGMWELHYHPNGTRYNTIIKTYKKLGNALRALEAYPA